MFTYTRGFNILLKTHSALTNSCRGNHSFYVFTEHLNPQTKFYFAKNREHALINQCN